MPAFTTTPSRLDYFSRRCSSLRRPRFPNSPHPDGLWDGGTAASFGGLSPERRLTHLSQAANLVSRADDGGGAPAAGEEVVRGWSPWRPECRAQVNTSLTVPAWPGLAWRYEYRKMPPRCPVPTTIPRHLRVSSHSFYLPLGHAGGQGIAGQ